MDKIILIYIICLFPCKAISQTDTIQSNIISYDEKIATSVSIQNFSDSFQYKFSYGTDKYNALFSPNTKQRLVTNINYKLININIGYTPSFLKNNNLKSRNVNLDIRLNHKKWSQSINFINQKGFFVIVNDINTFDNFYLPTFNTLKIGGTTSYVFNNKYSFGTLFNENEWQKKSSGSFIPNLSFYYTILKDSETKVRSEIFTISIAPSYYYNFIIYKRVLISAGILVGAGINVIDNNIRSIYETTVNFKVGYNSNSFFSYIGTSSSSFFDDNNQFQNSYLTSKVVIGYRFKMPKKGEKIYNNALKRLPIKFD